MSKINLFNFEIHKLEEHLMALGETKYRATQIYTWIYGKNARTFDEMSDISKKFRDVLNNEYCLDIPKIHTKQVSNDGTIKLLLEMSDGSKVETVLMRYSYGNVACVSSQVGCNMGCSFCASGLFKKKRNLETSEMVGEILVLNELLSKEENPSRVSHVVVMGTGEPFDNYDNVMDFVRIINHPKAFEIGARHITISTSGIVPMIYKYANEGLQINLAVSLHAPNNEIRDKIMKVNKAYPLEELIPAVREYEKISGRRATFEYILLKGVNDSIECADELSKLIKGMMAYVNLIPYNPVNDFEYERSENVEKFWQRLTRNGVTATKRKEFGTDIDAACGQLRAKDKTK